MPPIAIEIGGAVLNTPISNYFWNIGEGQWALGLVSAEQFNFPMSILGSIWMNNFDIVFDRANLLVTIHDISRCSGPPPPSRLLQTDV